MDLMDRIYVKSFAELLYPEQLKKIEEVRLLRSSAINEAKLSSKKLTKSAKRNLGKTKKVTRKRRKKNQEDIAKKALQKLTPEQIALIKNKLIKV